MKPGEFWFQFLTSAGFGGVAAVIGACLALIGISRQTSSNRDIADANHRAERELALSLDGRQRWWEADMWVDEHSSELSRRGTIEALDGLADAATTKEQIIMLTAVRRRSLPPTMLEEGAISE